MAAFLLAAALQVDTLLLVNRLSADDKMRDAFLAPAKTIQAAPEASAPTPSGKDAAIERRYLAFLADHGVITVPRSREAWVNGWNEINLAGVLVTGLLLSLGAPFWYNTLSRLLQLRSVLAAKDDQQRAQRQGVVDPGTGEKQTPRRFSAQPKRQSCFLINWAAAWLGLAGAQCRWPAVTLEIASQSMSRSVRLCHSSPDALRSARIRLGGDTDEKTGGRYRGGLPRIHPRRSHRPRDRSGLAGASIASLSIIVKLKPAASASTDQRVPPPSGLGRRVPVHEGGCAPPERPDRPAAGRGDEPALRRPAPAAGTASPLRRLSGTYVLDAANDRARRFADSCWAWLGKSGREGPGTRSSRSACSQRSVLSSTVRGAGVRHPGASRRSAPRPPGTRPAAGVTVAVVDTGVDRTHRTWRTTCG